MAESIVQVTEGSGKKLHTWQRTIGANSVEDEAVFPGEYPLASYTVVAGTISIATLNDHILQIMAGASLLVRIRRIWIAQAGVATTAANPAIAVFRLTTAGTGGTVVTPGKLDTADAASGATAMTLPTVKGTESTELFRRRIPVIQTQPVGGLSQMPFWQWEQHPGTKPIIIPAGATNGIAIKILNATAAGSVDVNVEFVETSFV